MIALWLSLSAFAADQDVTAPVSAVTVYLDRARVTREVTADVPAGRTDLVFDGLPLELIPESLAAEGEGTADATITGLDIRPQRGTEDRDQRIADLQKQRRTLEDQVREQQDVVARVQSDLTYLRGIKPQAPDQLDKALFLADDAAQQMAGTSKEIGAETAALLDEQRAAERKQRDIQKQIDQIDRQVQQLGQTGPDTTRVAVGLDAKKAGRVTLRLEYVVTGASWSPHYDARYRPADGKVRFDVSGEVQQQTGEDWKDVELTLSTARPQQGTAPPELEPFTLQEGYYGYGYTTATTTTGMAAGGENMPTGSAAVADRVTAFEFTSTRTEDVPADGTVRRVFLQSLDLTGTTVHQVVARKLEAAWLTSHVTNSADFALLPGAVSAYMGTAYVGEGQLGLVAPGDAFDVSFGVDDRVKVVRKRLTDVSADAKALQNRDHRHYGFKTTVTNHTGRAIDLVVTDQVPVSRDAAYEVKSKTTPEVTIPEGTGVFSWKETLADGKSEDFVVEYDVSWPQGQAPGLLD